MVTEVKVDTTGKKPYSIYTTTDGSTWSAVDGAVNVKADGVASYDVGVIATQVKYVFNEGSMWDYSTEYIAEIQVLGLDPADIECTHPTWTEWTVVPNSATCTEKGTEQRFCTVCNEQQTKASDAPPLGDNRGRWRPWGPWGLLGDFGDR